MSTYRPKVGEECEYLDIDGEWIPIKLTAFGINTCIILIDGGEKLVGKAGNKFRPVEKNLKALAIKEMGKYFHMNGVSELLENLYEAGYKPQGAAITQKELANFMFQAPMGDELGRANRLLNKYSITEKVN